MTVSTTQMTPWLDLIERSSSVGRFVEWVERGVSGSARGGAGSSAMLTTAALSRRAARPILHVVAHLDEAEEAVDELESLGIDAARVPAMEVLPGETSVAIDLLAERLRLVRRLLDGRGPTVLVAPIQALMQTVPQQDRIERLMRTIRAGDEVDSDGLIRWLDSVGYSRVEAVEHPGEFAVRGGIIDVFVPGETPVRIDLFGDEVDGIFEIDLETMGSDRRLDETELMGASADQLLTDVGTCSLLEMLSAQTVAVLAEVSEIVEQGRAYYDRVESSGGIIGPNDLIKQIGETCSCVVELNQYSGGSTPEHRIDLPAEPLPAFSETISTAIRELVELSQSHRAHVLCQNEGEAGRLRELLGEFGGYAADRIGIEVRYLHRGLMWRDVADGGPAVALVPYHELVHRYHTRRRVRRLGGGRTMDTFLELSPGDYVVHRDHGIAKFVGLKTMAPEKTAGGQPEEFLTLEFANRATLHVPATKIDLVQKYIGGFHGRPKLSTLGGKRWKQQKEKVGEAVRELAEQMLQIQASREAMPGTRFPADTAWQREFEAEFPYEETEDQLTAIDAIKRDMADDRPMDRLICGDVGFGKTEIAIRGAFKAAEFGKQVAVLVPTTVLAEQHERTFRQRFADYPFRIESISRFKSKKAQYDVLDALRKGQVDIVIGTHRLLSKDVKFNDLGLVIVDEEQRFGVEHKQKLLGLRMTADVLTLSATPIPRTLHMAMLGLRDISALSSPPPDRRAIVTEVIGYDRRRIKQAIERELAREGQVYFVHNRVHNIQSVADEVRQLVPDAHVIVGHGQMSGRELESVMLKFLRAQADILVCTTIIESGIDIPTVNTMLINDAQNFGLAELHQLRGRVGRYKHRAYCYMLLPQDQVLSEVAIKRMRAIESFSMLGAGFRIALRDLELRGAGNLLGPEQSGHIAAVGYEMYCRLLENAVHDLKAERPVETVDTTVEIGLSGAIPKGYIPSDQRRLEAYRRISTAATDEQLDAIRNDLISAYGDPPQATQTLLELAELRIAAAMLGVRRITTREPDVIIRTTQPVELQRVMAGIQGTLRLVGEPDSQGLAEVYFRPPASMREPQSLLTVLRRRLGGQHASAEPDAGRAGAR